MNQHLMDAMTQKGISTAALAAVIGVSEKTAYNKIRGISDFTFKEVVAIKSNLFPEYDVCYLFESEDVA